MSFIGVLFNKKNPFHLVTPSSWPIAAAFSLGLFLMTFVWWVHELSYYPIFELFVATVFLVVSISGWIRDVIVESTFEGNHTISVRISLKIGMALFIISEVMFFVSLFWAHFYCLISPNVYSCEVWPPMFIERVDPYKIPLLNTLLLLYSGSMLTLSHKALLRRERLLSIDALGMAIILGVTFSCFQLYEYYQSCFDISDSMFGSVFFVATGFHGLHVLVGTIMLSVTLIRHISYHLMDTVHVGFEISAWYWHFVDVVWLFLFLTLYV